MKNNSLAPVQELPAHEYRAQWRPDLKRAAGRHTARFIRRHGITVVALVIFTAWTFGVSAVSKHNARVEAEERLSAQYAAEYEAKLQAYIDEQDAIRRAVGDESLQAQMEREADALARAIGPMKTKRMKQSMLWNILVRVDSPFYPNTVEDVIAQPQQWMFYDERNPIRDDDRALALEQVIFWHEGRYPSGLTAEHVYGEWSENDYVLRNTWDKTSATSYWRMPE